MKATTAILILGAWCALGQQPAAPAPDSPQPDTVFTVTSALVQVDAVVTDSKGHHIVAAGRSSRRGNDSKESGAPGGYLPD